MGSTQDNFSDLDLQTLYAAQLELSQCLQRLETAIFVFDIDTLRQTPFEYLDLSERNDRFIYEIFEEIRQLGQRVVLTLQDQLQQRPQELSTLIAALNENGVCSSTPAREFFNEIAGALQDMIQAKEVILGQILQIVNPDALNDGLPQDLATHAFQNVLLNIGLPATANASETYQSLEAFLSTHLEETGDLKEYVSNIYSNITGLAREVRIVLDHVFFNSLQDFTLNVAVNITTIFMYMLLEAKSK